MVVPDTAWNDPLGGLTFPVRVARLSEVPAGRMLIVVNVFQLQTLPASKTRDTNVHGETYGVIRIQSTIKLKNCWKSLAPGRMLAVISVVVSVWVHIGSDAGQTSVPSMKKSVNVDVQLMR